MFLAVTIGILLPVFVAKLLIEQFNPWLYGAIILTLSVSISFIFQEKSYVFLSLCVGALLASLLLAIWFEYHFKEFFGLPYLLLTTIGSLIVLCAMSLQARQYMTKRPILRYPSSAVWGIALVVLSFSALWNLVFTSRDQEYYILYRATDIFDLALFNFLVPSIILACLIVKLDQILRKVSR